LCFGRSHAVQENNVGACRQTKSVRANTFFQTVPSPAPHPFAPSPDPPTRQGYPGGKVRPGGRGFGTRIRARALRNSLSRRGISGILLPDRPGDTPSGGHENKHC
jgi:hypothetical protein